MIVCTSCQVYEATSIVNTRKNCEKWRPVNINAILNIETFNTSNIIIKLSIGYDFVFAIDFFFFKQYVLFYDINKRLEGIIYFFLMRETHDCILVNNIQFIENENIHNNCLY